MIKCLASCRNSRGRLSELLKEIEDLRKEAAASQDGNEENDGEIPAVSLKREVFGEVEIAAPLVFGYNCNRR